MNELLRYKVVEIMDGWMDEWKSGLLHVILLPSRASRIQVHDNKSPHKHIEEEKKVECIPRVVAV